MGTKVQRSRQTAKKQPRFYGFFKKSHFSNFSPKSLEVTEKLCIFADELQNCGIMTNKNRYVLNQIRQVAKSTAPEGSSVLLFGSRARGQARKGSDWDILIVLPKSHLQQADYDQVSYPLVELGWMLGEQINPIVYTEQEWKANSITPFYDNVLRDAVSLL